MQLPNDFKQRHEVYEKGKQRRLKEWQRMGGGLKEWRGVERERESSSSHPLYFVVESALLLQAMP